MSDSPVEAAKAISGVIDAADEEVIISSGKLIHSCYETDQLIGSISKAITKRVKFKVLVGPHPDNDSKRFLSMLKDSIYLAPSEPKVHFAIADGGKKLRIERKDIDEDDYTDNEIRKRDYVTGSYLRDKLLATIPHAAPYNEKGNH